MSDLCQKPQVGNAKWRLGYKRQTLKALNARNYPSKNYKRNRTQVVQDKKCVLCAKTISVITHSHTVSMCVGARCC